MKRPSLLLASFIALSSVLAAHIDTIVGSRIPEFTIEDQFEREWRTSDFRGRTTVFVVSDRSGYEYSPNWTGVLVPRFKSSPVRFIPVADVQSVPGFLKGFIRGKFKDEFTYAVLMDWEGVLIKAFRITEGVPNLIIVDKNGIIQHAVHGEGTADQIASFTTRLEQILAQR